MESVPNWKKKKKVLKPKKRKFLITIQVEFDLLGVYFFDPHELHLHITLRWGRK